VVLDQVEQCPAYLHRRQVVEVAHRLGAHVSQGAVQPKGSVLQHVVGLLPALQSGKALQHAACQPPQALAGVGQKLVASLGVPLAQPVQPVLHLRRVAACLCHRSLLP
jgi:hypothetical protein